MIGFFGAERVVIHQRQPTRTSCGPTSAAMLVGVPVARMLRRLPRARRSPSRRRLTTDRTNVGELGRLIAPYGLTLDRRTRGLPVDANPAVLRVEHAVGRGWHWTVAAYGYVFDPAADRPVRLSTYARAVGRARLTWYPVRTT